jgi:hypothetical protein
MQRMIRQQVQELTQQHPPVGHLLNLVESQATWEEVQWLGIITWMQESEPKWDTRQEDVKMRGVGITNMITKTMTGVAQGEEGRQKEREMTAMTDGVGLEAP